MYAGRGATTHLFCSYLWSAAFAKQSAADKVGTMKMNTADSTRTPTLGLYLLMLLEATSCWRTFQSVKATTNMSDCIKLTLNWPTLCMTCPLPFLYAIIVSMPSQRMSLPSTSDGSESTTTYTRQIAAAMRM